MHPPTVGWLQVRLAQIGFLILFCHNCNNNLYQSLKQRLGKSNIQARLGRPVGVLMRGGPAGGRGGMRGMTRGGLRGRARGGAMRGALSLRGLCSHPCTVSPYCCVNIFDSSPQFLSPNALERTWGIKHSIKWEVLAWRCNLNMTCGLAASFVVAIISYQSDITLIISNDIKECN